MPLLLMFMLWNNTISKLSAIYNVVLYYYLYKYLCSYIKKQNKVILFDLNIIYVHERDQYILYTYFKSSLDYFKLI